MKHTLPKLGYEYDALEPFIDTKTMEIHHTKHHQSYVDKLNIALEKFPELKDKKVEELLKNSDSLPIEIKNSVRNNGGGHFNHSFFWKLLKKDTAIKGRILEEINSNFGSFENFKKLFTEAAMNRFGSGWAWLVLDRNKLEIISTPNQDSPISNGKIPILTLDLWEHAYYLKFQNRRNEYIETFFNIINWDQVNKNLKEGLK